MAKKQNVEKNPRGKRTAEEQSTLTPEPQSGFTRAERKEAGKLARQKAPLQSHSKTMVVRRDIVKVLEQSNKGRVPELIPVRYGRMLASPFTFYRGSASLMALDLARTQSSGITVQACGDCHIQNFGAFATPERKIVIDINDFDETLPAPWEWDVKRLAASLVLAASSNGFDADLGKEAAYQMTQSYREHIDELSKLTALEVWYSHIQLGKVLQASMSDTRRRLQEQLKSAIEKSSSEVIMEKMTVLSKGRLRFKDIPPLLCHIEDLRVDQEARHNFKHYRQSLPEDRRILLDKYELVDLARKVVGIGSVGTVCGVALLAGQENDALILQIKEARESVLEPYAGRSKYEHHGQRVVAGQKLMQAASDIFLGWTTGRKPEQRHFFVRQLRDVKIGVNTALWNKADFKTFPAIAGQILARAHARSSDASMMRGYLGKSDEFDEAIAHYALAYAKQTEHDYQQFVKACKSGLLKAQTLD